MGSAFLSFIPVVVFSAKRSILGQKKDYWGVLESAESKIPSLPDMLTSIRNMPNIKYVAYLQNL